LVKKRRRQRLVSPQVLGGGAIDISSRNKKYERKRRSLSLWVQRSLGVKKKGRLTTISGDKEREEERNPGRTMAIGGGEISENQAA